MSKEEILNEIKDVTVIANTDTDTVDPRVRSGWESAKRDAQDRLVALRDRYKQHLFENGVAIFLDGSPGQQIAFANLAVQEANSIKIKVPDLYEVLSVEAEPSLGTERTFTNHQVMLIETALGPIKSELKFREPTRLRLADIVVTPDHASFVDYVRTLVRTAAEGDELNKLYIVRSIIEQSIAAGYTHNTVPVVFVNAKEEEVQALQALFSKSHTVTIGAQDEINAEYVIEQFKDIQTKIKPQNNNQKTNKKGK